MLQCNYKAVVWFGYLLVQNYRVQQKKRYKSCHWGCTFLKGKLLSILGANMYILSVNMYILGANMSISGANMSILGPNMYILGANMYI